MINIKCHYFRHQIREFGNNQKIDNEAINNLNKLIRIYDSIYHTENEALNVILNGKTLLCNNKSIRFTCIVDGNALNFIENEDIYSLFGNLIDNSIEAINQLDDNEKIISLKIKQVGNIVSISIKNGYKGKIQMENNLPLSKKEDNIHHGFGMKSIKMVCEKYNENLKLNIENNIFIVTILFIKRSD